MRTKTVLKNSALSTMHFLSVAAAGFLFFGKTVNAQAAPNLQARSVTTLSSAELASLAPFTQFARATYCPSGLSTWKCGGEVPKAISSHMH